MVITEATLRTKKAFRFMFHDEPSASAFLQKALSLSYVGYAQFPRSYYHNEDASKTEVLVTGITGSTIHDVALLSTLSKEAEILGGCLVHPAS